MTIVSLAPPITIFAQDEKSNDVASPEIPKIDQPIYVVTKNHFAEGFEENSAKFADLIMIEIVSANASSKTQGSYRVGKEYKILSGGEFIGSVIVKKIVDLQCDSTAAVVKPTSSTKLPKDNYVLATNSKIVKSHTSNISTPSESDKTQALNLANSEFKKHGVKVKKVSEIKIENIKMTQFLPASSKSIVGSFSLKGSTSLDRVFLIADRAGTEFKPTLVKFNHSIDLEDGKDDTFELFVDQADMEGNGNDEVITQVTGYEFEEFWVYKRKNDGWVKILIGGSGGC
jgi:hypothetical protein